MSGPIVRRYGFPNFEKIFGDRGLQHGVDEEPKPDDSAGKAPSSESAAPPKNDNTQEKKASS